LQHPNLSEIIYLMGVHSPKVVKTFHSILSATGWTPGRFCHPQLLANISRTTQLPPDGTACTRLFFFVCPTLQLYVLIDEPMRVSQDWIKRSKGASWSEIIAPKPQ